MVNKSGAIGTKGETAVVRVLVPNGWPNAERRSKRGILDPGDITGTPGIAWSVKAGEQARTASDADVAKWLLRAEDMRQNTGSDFAVLVMHRRGFGYERAEHWWAIVSSHVLAVLVHPSLTFYPDAPCVPARMTLAELIRLLRWADYGDPLDESETA